MTTAFLVIVFFVAWWALSVDGLLDQAGVMRGPVADTFRERDE